MIVLATVVYAGGFVAACECDWGFLATVFWPYWLGKSLVRSIDRAPDWRHFPLNA
jgi:hypothetical protein